MLHALRFSLQNAVYFIKLHFWFLYYSHFTYRMFQNLKVKPRCQKVIINICSWSRIIVHVIETNSKEYKN
jgi:hypothetical protein